MQISEIELSATKKNRYFCQFEPLIRLSPFLFRNLTSVFLLWIFCNELGFHYHLVEKPVNLENIVPSASGSARFFCSCIYEFHFFSNCRSWYCSTTLVRFRASLFALLYLILFLGLVFVGVDAPITQTTFNYFLLALIYGGILLYRRQRPLVNIHYMLRRH